MINLMIKNIFENTNRIDNMAKYINKINTKHCLHAMMLTVGFYLVVKTVENQEERIKELENELEEMKSKGE